MVKFPAVTVLVLRRRRDTPSAEKQVESLSRAELEAEVTTLRQRVRELEAIVQPLEAVTSNTTIPELNLSELAADFTSVLPRAAAGEQFLITYSNGPVLAILTRYDPSMHGEIDSITQSKLNQRMSQQVARATAGKTLRITIRGNPASAVLVPPPPKLKNRPTPAIRRKIAAAMALERVGKNKS